jgi:hypothetical protein
MIVRNGEANNVVPENVKLQWNQVKQNNSKKEKNEYNFDTWINIHRPHHAFIKFLSFDQMKTWQYYTKIIIVVHGCRLDFL